MTKIDPKELAQLRVMFALRRMAPAMQNDVLSDGMVAARAGIDLSHPIKVPEGITLERKLLFSAFQRAADHEPIPDLIDAAGVKHDIRVEIEGESAFPYLWDPPHTVCARRFAVSRSRPPPRRRCTLFGQQHPNRTGAPGVHRDRRQARLFAR